jgi:cytochrome c oxidase assembly factor CtaG
MSIWVDANGWPIPPTVLLGCLIVEILYFRGWRVLVKAEQAKRVPLAPSAFTGFDGGRYRWDSWFWRGTYFLGAIFIILLGDSAPVDILSSRFFWVHMIQHLLILVVMAPLLVGAAPLLPMWLGLPHWTRRLLKEAAKPKVVRPFNRVGHQLGHLLRQPAVSCALLIAGTWVWHWPPLYDLALTNEIIHDWCEHLTFLAVSVLFWAQVIPSPPLRPHPGYLGRMLCIGIAIAQNVVLAVLLGFAQTPLYAPYAQLAHGAGGLSALQDQQLGAGIMWTFGDLPFMIAIGILLQQWLASQSDEAGTAIKSHKAEG